MNTFPFRRFAFHYTSYTSSYTSSSYNSSLSLLWSVVKDSVSKIKTGISLLDRDKLSWSWYAGCVSLKKLRALSTCDQPILERYFLFEDVEIRRQQYEERFIFFNLFKPYFLHIFCSRTRIYKISIYSDLSGSYLQHWF